MARKLTRATAPIALTFGALAYVMAVTQRSTMGVASLAATDRFHTNAEQLSMLAVMQLVMYAAMQIPVGLLLDRFGPRRLIFSGTILMALGQFLVAFSDQLGVAITGRMIVGVGDACVFISMIRLINVWYSGSRASQLQQWLANAGQVGQVLSAFPFALLLKHTSWSFAFGTWAAMGMVVAFGVWILALDDTKNNSNQHQIHIRARLQHLRQDIKRSSTKTAFWVHLSTMSPGTVMLLLWGVPFLEQAEGLERSVALSILSSFVVMGVVFGMFYGWLCGRYPEKRRFAMGIGASFMLVGWVAVILWPGPAPLWLIAIWAIGTSGNGSASMIAFDYTRQYAPKRQLGSINGFVNIGGFVASFSMMFAIGLVLDIYYELFGKAAGLQLYSLDGFKLAFVVVPLVIGIGQLRYRANEAKLSTELANQE